MNEALRILLDKPTFTTKDALQLITTHGGAETPNATGDTLLHRLVTYETPMKKHNTEAVTTLIKTFGLDIDLLNGRHKTALQCLMDLSHWATCDALLLIELGANPRQFDSLGQTLLHRLVTYCPTGIKEHNLKAITRLVVDGLLDINIKNKQGKTPLHHLLDSLTFKASDALFLVNLGADPTVIDSSGQTLIHRLIAANQKAISDEALDVIIKLVESGKVAINIPNQMGKTPLQYLLDQPCLNPTLALTLIQLGADIYTTNSKGESLLYRLATSSTDHSAMIYKLINEYHVNPETLNTACKTPIDVALEGIKHNNTHLANISTLLENSNSVASKAHASFIHPCPSRELMLLNKLLATIHSVGGSLSYELQKKIRDTAFDALQLSLADSSHEEKLEKLKWARELPLFCNHRSHFFLATIGRTNTVIKIDEMIAALEKSPPKAREVALQESPQFFPSPPMAVDFAPSAPPPPAYPGGSQFYNYLPYTY